ncbi:unnamed protein product [Cylicocyclus nassatus]|uniref:Uncharacterized protein n=1 Tax=Cylicocyclus nassatus TaxID=53992 RepID=A0AA36MDY8_CYLNA|nr:unnamed protein product [Cylicocyclus nassatus]
MDSHRKSRRSSILKVRQTEVEIETTTAVQSDNKQVLKRRVSFHNVKTVQNFEKGDLNLLEGSPFKEKIQETMSSDGILTPGRSTAHSTPSTASGIENNTHFADDTMTAFEKGPRERLTYNDVTRYSPIEMSFGDTTAMDAPCSPNDDNLLENSVSNNDTMAAFVKGNKARLSYDRITNYSLADMSLVETTVTDSTDAQNTAEAFGSTCHSSADMSISDNTFTTDVPQKGVLNTTRCSNVDMSLDSTADCSSRSSNDTQACLENIGKPRKLPSTLQSDHRVADRLFESSRYDITLDETIMAFVKAGQRKCIYQSPSHSPVEKLSSTTFCDDTALAFKGASNLTHTYVEEKEEIPTDSDMDVTSACTMHESEAEEKDTALNKTFDIVSSNKSCQSLAEASSAETTKEFTAIAVSNNEPCEIVALNNDGKLFEAEEEEEIVHNASIDGSLGKAEAMSILSATFTKTHLDSPGVVDRKRQRIMDKSEAMEEMEEQRRADVSSFQRMDPISIEHLFGEKMKGHAEEALASENMQGDSVATKLESTALCEISMDITQQNTDAVDVTQENEHGNRTALLGDTLHTLAEQVDDMEISAVQKNATTNESIYEFINESTYTKRDISILPSGSRFRPNASKDDTILSVKSLRDETTSLSCRMMFDSHSLQVNYVNVLDDQPDSNMIREQISEELATKINEMYQRSDKEFGLLLPELQEKDAVKALAVKNMATRALSFDDADMLQSARLLAEIEWANARSEVAKQAVLGTEQSIANDELELAQLIEDSRLCGQLDQLETEVQALKEELIETPSAAEASEIIRSYENALKEEEELDRKILKEEIEWLRDELQAARQRKEELRKENEELIEIERRLERNSATVRALKQQILDRRQMEPNSSN